MAWIPAELRASHPEGISLDALEAFRDREESRPIDISQSGSRGNQTRCNYRVGETFLCGHYGAQSFSAAVRAADAIYVGDVIAVTPGFFLGHPASLLTVKLDGDFEAGQGTILITSPFTEFESEGSTFCGQSGLNPGQRAHVGDRIIALSAEPPLDDNASLVYVTTHELIVEHDGVAAVPFNLKDDSSVGAARSFASVVLLLQNEMLKAGKTRECAKCCVLLQSSRLQYFDRNTMSVHVE